MSTMRSFFLPTGFGRPSTYKLGELPKPTVSENDQVLFKVHAASLNPIDMRIAEGSLKYIMPAQEFPSKIGYDASGVIEDVGTEAAKNGWKVGDEIFVRLPHETRGSLSEYAVVSDHFIARKPRNISHVEAASIPLVSMTAYQALGRIDGGLAALKDKTILVTAGLGGGGSMGVQLAKAFGAKEVITTISGSKLPRAKELFDGVVDTFIDYKKTDPATAIPARSLDFILDTAGGNVASLFPLLKKDHQCISFAALPSGTSMKELMPSTPWYVAAPLNLVSKFKIDGPAKNAGIRYAYHPLEPNGKDLGEIGKLIEEGKVKPVIGDVFQYTEEDCRKASEIVTGNGSPKGGKVVIKIVD